MKTSVNISCRTPLPVLHAPMHIIQSFIHHLGASLSMCNVYIIKGHPFSLDCIMLDRMYIIQSCNTFHDFSVLSAASCPQATVTVLSVLLSLVLTLSLSTCTVSAVVSAVMYKRLQRCRAELRGGELCSTPQLYHAVPPVKQGCWLTPCRGRGQCQSRSRRRGTSNRGGGGGGREDAG